jgi:hypothetical protein
MVGRHGLEMHTQSCTILKDANGKSPKTVLMTIGVVLPMIILIIANSMIYYKVTSQGFLGICGAVIIEFA